MTVRSLPVFDSLFRGTLILGCRFWTSVCPRLCFRFHIIQAAGTGRRQVFR